MQIKSIFIFYIVRGRKSGFREFGFFGAWELRIFGGGSQNVVYCIKKCNENGFVRQKDKKACLRRKVNIFPSTVALNRNI